MNTLDFLPPSKPVDRADDSPLPPNLDDLVVDHMLLDSLPSLPDTAAKSGDSQQESRIDFDFSLPEEVLEQNARVGGTAAPREAAQPATDDDPLSVGVDPMALDMSLGLSSAPALPQDAPNLSMGQSNHSELLDQLSLQSDAEPQPPFAVEDNSDNEPSPPPAKQGLLARLLPCRKATPPAQPQPAPRADESSEQPNIAEEPAKAGFIQRFKAPLVIGAVVVGLMGWNHFKKGIEAQAIAAQQQAAASADQQPYELALKEMQSEQGLPSEDPSAPFENDGAADIFGEDASVAGDVFAEAPAEAPQALPQAAAPAEVPAANAPPVIPEVSTAVKPEPQTASLAAGGGTPDPMAQVQSQVDKANAKIAELQAENAELKKRIDALLAEKAKPATAQSVAKKPVQPKPPVAGAQAQSRPAQTKPTREKIVAATRVEAKPVVQPPRKDVEFLGAFRDGAQIRAHALIGSTVMELSPGQKIGSLKVESVSMEGVTINGHLYR